MAVGSVGMASGFSDSSSQGSFMTAFQSTVPGGTELTVMDSAGNILCAYTPQKDFQSVVISTPSVVVGETYTITAGEQRQTVAMSQIATNSGGMGGDMMPDGPGGGRGGNRDGGWGDLTSFGYRREIPYRYFNSRRAFHVSKRKFDEPIGSAGKRP